MNDLYYIKYEAKVMLLDTMAMTPAVELTHRRFCDYLWVHEEFPLNADHFLIEIGRAPAAALDQVRSGLQRKGWFVRGEFLVHGGALKSLNEAKRDYVNRFNQTAGMRKADRLTCEEDPETGIITIRYPEQKPVTADVTGDAREAVTGRVPKGVTGGVTISKSKSEQESELEPVPSKDIKSNYSKERKVAGTKLTFLVLDRVARDIVGNKHEWDYDNCKVHAGQFTQASIVAKLKAFVGVIPADERLIHQAWQEAVTRTHQAAVDGLIRTTPPGYCITIFTEQLNKLRDVSIAE